MMDKNKMQLLCPESYIVEKKSETTRQLLAHKKFGKKVKTICNSSWLRRLSGEGENELTA